MKILLILAIPVLLLFPVENDKEKMQWDESRPLTWSDFKGVPNGSDDYVASTNSGISLSYSIGYRNGEYKFNFTVQSNFYPKQSWYRPEAASEYILKHEQTHFDISELHARKLRKKLMELDVTENVKADADKLYSEIEQERRDMQHRFDSDSDHSKLRELELEWRDFIASELEKYDSWK
ncbi:DUF922 domain-containing protein [Pukyongia salina]|uniref:DUF922 domain-containing protein n=1 Tax=Pukyongia salina TaxID=2094025 RepID=A0A2S0HT64_9FLAO|nr:DUF922 domain-containing protein [Pukyongia salina]AVI49832.1 DUF922 domain-containing protein [Pukyongia salina]